MEGQLLELIRHKIVDNQATALPQLTHRDVRVPAMANKAVAVVGMRRSGKTSLLWQELSRRVAAGVPRECLLYFTFEDERLADLTMADLGLVSDAFFQLNPQARSTAGAAVFLDEIQVVTGWERYVRRLLDSERLDVFLSGSSAKLLSREVATSMRGRAMECQVLPFSFREHLRHLGHEPGKSVARLTRAERSSLEHALDAYLLRGGFPEAQAVAERDRVDLLRSYVDVVLLRDVIERHAVTHPVALRWLTRQLLANAGGSFSISKLHHDLRAQGIPIGKDTLHANLAHLEDAFLIRTLNVASNSERRRMVIPRKVYGIDSGFISVFERGGRSNTGHALENAVLLELMRRGHDVSYVRNLDGSEVDFLAVDHERNATLVQVCADLRDSETLRREVHALLAAQAAHRGAAMLIVALHSAAKEPLPSGIRVASASTWLLEDA